MRRAAAAAAVPTHPSILENSFPFHQTSFNDALDDETLRGVQLGWQPLDLGCILTPPFGTAHNSLAGEPVHETDGPSGSPPSPGDGISAHVRQLTTLAADIDRLHRDLPTATVCHIPKDRSPEEFLEEYSSMFDAQQCLELLFSSGNALLDLYPDVLEALFSKSRDAVDCQHEDCFHIEDSVYVPSQDGPQPNGLSRKLDIFLFNLLVLCHKRLLDVFGIFLSHAHLCARVATVYPNGKEPRVSVPELRVGKFVASRSSSSTMQAVLLGHVASVLKTRSGQLRIKVGETLGDDHDDKQSRILRLQCEVLEEDSVAKVDELQKVTDRLNNLGFPI